MLRCSVFYLSFISLINTPCSCCSSWICVIIVEFLTKSIVEQEICLHWSLGIFYFNTQVSQVSGVRAVLMLDICSQNVMLLVETDLASIRKITMSIITFIFESRNNFESIWHAWLLANLAWDFPNFMLLFNKDWNTNYHFWEIIPVLF